MGIHSSADGRYERCIYMMQSVITRTILSSVVVFTSLRVTISNGAHSLSFGFPNCPRASATATLGQLHSTDSVQSQSYITTDSQSASLSWCQAPIWDPRPIFPILSLIIF
jgi:hypothetical protein